MTLRRIRVWERIHTIEDLADANPALALHLIQGLNGARARYSRNSPEIDHIFPRSELRRFGHDEDDINDIANFWILAQGKNRNKSNRAPRYYFADVAAGQLKKALIDPEMLKSYRSFKRFIRGRRPEIVAAVSKQLGLTDADLARA